MIPFPPLPRCARRAFSVVELLIALVVFSLAMSFFVFGMVGRRTEGVKSAAWFNAVSLAQKICDDLDHRARENPYALDELDGLPDEFPLLGPGAPLFRFLEDDDGNRRLGDGAPLPDLIGTDREALATMRVALRIRRGVGNGTARAELTLRWREGSREQTYALHHLLSDRPESVRDDPGSFELPNFSDAYLVAAFFAEAGDLDELARARGVDRSLLNDLATIQYLSRTGARTLLESEAAVRRRRDAAGGFAATGLAETAALHERCALDLLRLHIAAAPAAARLAAREADGTLSFGTLLAERPARALLPDLARFARRIMTHDNGACFAARLPAELTSAFNLSLRVAADASLASDASYRRRAAAGAKAVEYAVALAQSGAGTMRADFGGRIVPLRQHLLDGLAALEAQARNRDYNRADWLARVAARIRADRFEPWEDISARLDTMDGVAAVCTRLLARATDLMGGGGFY